MNYEKAVDAMWNGDCAVRGVDWPEDCFVWFDERHDVVCWQDGDDFDLPQDVRDQTVFEILEGAIIPPPLGFKPRLRPKAG